MKLTEGLIRDIAPDPGKKDRLVSDDDMPGLYVRAGASGSKRFVCQWVDPATKRNQRDTLGVWPVLTLAGARAAVRVRLGDVAKGINPRAERIKAKIAADRDRSEKALTFDALVSDWVTLHLASRRPRYAEEAERAIRLLFADIIKKPAARITRSEVVERLDSLVKAGKATTAGRTLAYARAAFGWAVKRGKLDANPFTGLPVPVPNNQRERVLMASEVREVWTAAGQLTAPFGAFYRLALLTLARRDEVAGMLWTELDSELSAWTIPGSRTKNGNPHTVHLTQAARDVLATVFKVKDQEYVFSTTGTTPISGYAWMKRSIDAKIIDARKKADADTKSMTPWVLHDFRRSGVSALAMLGFDIIVADKLLNHQPTRLHGAGLVYQRHDFADERARALEAWSAFVLGTFESSNVVFLERAG